MAAVLHGDIFPLPVPSVAEVLPPGAPRYAVQRRRQKVRRESLVRDAVRGLNALAADSVRVPLPRTSDSILPVRPNACQESALEHVRSCISGIESPPAGLSGARALRELFKSDSLYEAPGCVVQPFDPERFSVLSSKLVPRPIVDLAPDAVRGAFLDPDLHVRRGTLEMEAACEGTEPIRVYWDEQLRTDRALRIKFILDLAGRGLIGFRRAIRSKVGCFFVPKKNGSLRMVVDARETNRCHRAPPHAALSTPAAWTEVGLPSDGAPMYGASLDLRDCFYQFCDDGLAEDFGIPFAETATTWGISSIWSAEGPLPVDPSEVLFAVFRVVPMGWSWAP